MSLCEKCSESIGKFGKLRFQTTVQIAASDLGTSIAQYQAVHNGTLVIPCATEQNEGTGKIDEIKIRLLNGTTAAVFPELTAYVFNKDIEGTVPTAGSNIAMTAAEYASLQNRIDIPIATGFAGASPNTLRSEAEGVELNRKFQAAEDDNTLYIVLINKSSTTLTLDAAATIEVDIMITAD